VTVLIAERRARHWHDVRQQEFMAVSRVLMGAMIEIKKTQNPEFDG